jgi:hypothetical protein
MPHSMLSVTADDVSRGLGTMTKRRCAALPTFGVRIGT